MLNIFSAADWARIQKAYGGWWDGTREEPIIHLAFTGAEPGMPRPEGMVTGDLYKYPESESAESIAEKHEYMMRCLKYEFEGYPHAWLYFGPIHHVEFFGCKAHPADTTVWFAPEKDIPISERHISVDPESIYLPRQRAILKALDERFQGGYVTSSAPSGGYALDAVAEFYGHERLSYMLYDEPEEVLRLMDEYDAAEVALGRELERLTPRAEGFTSWGGIFAPEHWTTMQCDYSAMIGPKAFETFALPDLVRSARRSPKYNYYHLDGPGEIVHLDTILAVPDLKCVQWVAAPHGEPALDIDVYGRIFKGGKRMWVTGPIERAEQVAQRNGTARGIYWYGVYPMSEYDRVMKIADRLQGGH